MPIQEPIVGIPGFEAFEITGTKQVVTTSCELRDTPTCPGCKSVGPHRRKDLIQRRIRHTSIGTRAHWLVVHVPKWSCRCDKMELISRRAYGFRNFQNYRLRVRALCG